MTASSRPACRTRRRAAALVVLTVALLGTTAGPVAPAGAADGSGASSRVTRDGRIITAIINRTPIRYTGRGTAPTSYWLTLTDGELSFVLALVAADPSLENTFLDVLTAMSDAGTGVAADVQVQISRGRFTGAVRSVPADPAAPAQVLARRMITSLPALPSVISPPRDAPAVIGEPVFTSFDPATWDTVIDRTLTAGDVSARVRAHPVSFTVRSGDPKDLGAATCNGPGTPFDPEDPASPTRQAARPGTCAVTYRTVTGVDDRRDVWYGSLVVVWRAEWTTDGTNWRSLGDIPQISVLARRVVPATTAIEAPF